MCGVQEILQGRNGISCAALSTPRHSLVSTSRTVGSRRAEKGGSAVGESVGVREVYVQDVDLNGIGHCSVDD
jgi:hypothetical protein